MMETHTHSSEDVHRRIDVWRGIIADGTPETPALLGQMIEYKDLSFRIDKVSETPNHGLYLAVTSSRPPADPVQFFITLAGPPETRSADDEKQALFQVLYGMLERGAS